MGKRCLTPFTSWESEVVDKSSLLQPECNASQVAGRVAGCWLRQTCRAPEELRPDRVAAAIKGVSFCCTRSAVRSGLRLCLRYGKLQKASSLRRLGSAGGPAAWGKGV